jgi:hypothetical protein
VRDYLELERNGSSLATELKRLSVWVPEMAAWRGRVESLGGGLGLHLSSQWGSASLPRPDSLALCSPGRAQVGLRDAASAFDDIQEHQVAVRNRGCMLQMGCRRTWPQGDGRPVR